MKILFVAPRYHPNQHYWATALQKENHQVSYAVLTKSESENYETLTPEVIPKCKLPLFLSLVTKIYEKITLIQTRKSRYMWTDYSYLSKHINTFGPDVVIVRDLSTWLSIQTLFITRKNKIPTILYTQQPLEQKKKTLTRILQFLNLAPKTRISPVRQNQKKSNYKNETFFVPLIANKNELENLTRKKNKKIKIMFVGKFGLPRKNHLLLLQVLNSLRNEGFKFEATLIGSYHDSDKYHYDKILNYIKNNKLESVVTLKKNIPQDRMSYEYLNHDIFILPSVGEPFAISVLEAMSYGLPVIISDSGGAQYCIEQGRNGYVVEKNSVYDLTEKIKTILEMDNNQLNIMSKNSLDYIRDNHTEKQFIEALIPVIEKVTKN